MRIIDVLVKKLTVMQLCVVWCSLVFALPPKKVFITTGAAEHGVQSGTAKPLFSIGLGPFSLQLGVQQWGHLPIGQMPQAGLTVPANITLPSLTVLVPNAVLNVSGLQQPGAQPPVVWVIPVPNGGGAPMPTPIPPNGGTVMLPPGTLQPVPAPMPIPPVQFPWEMGTTVVVPGQQQGGGGGGGSGIGGGGGGGSGEGGGFLITETIDSMGNVVQTITPVGQQPDQLIPGQTVIVPGQTVVVEEVVNPQPNQPGVIRKGVITRLTGVVLQRNNTKPIINFIKGH